MGLALAYWIVMLLWLLGWGASHFEARVTAWLPGGGIVLYALFLIIGWAEFGAPLHK